jgi:hypothetical protein
MLQYSSDHSVPICPADGADYCSSSQGSNSACKRCVQHIAIGERHLCVMLYDCSIECAGTASYGEAWRGAASYSNKLVPAPALAGMTITTVGSGLAHSCVLTAVSDSEGSNKVYCVGWNRSGELGDGTLEPSSVPVAVQGLQCSRIAQLAAGGVDNCVVYADPGSLMQCWGSHFLRANVTGGVVKYSVCIATAIPGTAGAKAVTVPAGNGDSCAVLQNSTVVCWYLDINYVYPIERLQNVVRVAVGSYFGCAVVQGEGSDAHGSVWCLNMGSGRTSVFIAGTGTGRPRKVVGLPGSAVDVGCWSSACMCSCEGAKCKQWRRLLLGLQQCRAIGTRACQCHNWSSS